MVGRWARVRRDMLQSHELCGTHTHAHQGNLFTHSTETGAQWEDLPPGKGSVAARQLPRSFKDHAGDCVG